MKLNFLPFILSFLAILLLGGSGQAATVDDLRVGAHPDKMRIAIDMTDYSEFRAFVSADPWQIMIDMPSFEWKVGRIAKPPHSGVKSVKQGTLKAGTSRIVIDLEKPAQIVNAFFIPATGRTPDRLVIDYKYVTAVKARAQADKIFGRQGDEKPPLFAALPADGNPSAEPTVPGSKPDLIIQPVQQLNQEDKTAPVKTRPGPKPLIVIGPGHGGIDPGAPGANGLFEKNIVLAMAKSLKKQLDSTGKYRVILTRDKDVFLKLHERVLFARNRKADLFVSIHADSVNKPDVRGTSIYTLSEKASDAQTAKLAARENRADLIGGVNISNEDEQVANILVDLVRRDNQNQSKFFANRTVEALRRDGFRLLDNPHRFAGFAVLKAPDIPSVLIEIGFMSNQQESSQLSNEAHRVKVARALAAGIDGYFTRIGKGDTP